VCWRLCADLAARGHRVRLWVDDATALQWMAPGALAGTWPGVQVLPWTQSSDATVLATLAPADVWVEAFGCDIATEFIAEYAYITRASGQNNQQHPVWINLEYLSAEAYVERSHGLPSPVMSGPAKGWTKHFFYPGFTQRTGGLLREPGLMKRQQDFVEDGKMFQWLAGQGVNWKGERLVSLFCYEPCALAALLASLNALPTPTHVLVTAGRATRAVQALRRADQQFPNLRLTYLPALTQRDFDHLLWTCDLNFVRGEDSLVRAIWAGKPLVWQIYPQQDGAHIAKLNAFLDTIQADATLRSLHLAWNRTDDDAGEPPLPLIDLNSWSKTVLSTRARQLQMDDLTTQLLHFVLKKR
jgi:uncharacterized repeat protein (TIGR03837 family)